jgi:hypothetical protein
MSEAAAESQMSVAGKPSCDSSKAVRRAPGARGRGYNGCTGWHGPTRGAQRGDLAMQAGRRAGLGTPRAHAVSARAGMAWLAKTSVRARKDNLTSGRARKDNLTSGRARKDNLTSVRARKDNPTSVRARKDTGRAYVASLSQPHPGCRGASRCSRRAPGRPGGRGSEGRQAGGRSVAHGAQRAPITMWVWRVSPWLSAPTAATPAACMAGTARHGTARPMRVYGWHGTARRGPTRSCSARMTPSAVPKPAVAREPAVASVTGAQTHVWPEARQPVGMPVMRRVRLCPPGCLGLVPR